MAKFSFNSEQDHYLVLGACGLAAVAFIYTALSTPLGKIPGPWYSNFTGQVLRYYGLLGKRTEYVHSLHKKYGPVVRLAPDEVDVMDIPSVKAVHSYKATYIKSPKFYTSFQGPDSENIFSTTDIHLHRRHRKLLSSEFSETSLKAFHPIVEGRVNLAIKGIRKEMQTRGAADVFKWFIFMATDIIGELSFGESFKMLELGKKNDYAWNLEKVGAVTTLRTAFPFLAWLSHYGVPVPGFGDSSEFQMKMVKYATESLQRYQRLVEENPEKPLPTLFTKLFRGEEEEVMTFKEILNSAMTYIVAGTDTTAVAMTYIVWNVCKNPEVRNRLLRELRKLPEDYHDYDLQKIPYLSQVVDETLRLNPPAPSALPRIVPPEGATFGGHYLPGGSTVCTQAWSLHMNPETFPDPERFNPSRWDAPTKEMKDSLMPFGAGSRICIGLHLARMELRLATAGFFRAFPNTTMSTQEGMSEDDMKQTFHFLAPPKNKWCLMNCV